MRVLIVDDSLYMRHILKDILERNEIQVVGMAGSGSEGVEQYKAIRPDVVTMDITMPDMDGLAALRSIRAFDSKARVIMVSAMGNDAMMMEAMKNGAYNFIVKPFKEENIMEIMLSGNR